MKLKYHAHLRYVEGDETIKDYFVRQLINSVDPDLSTSESAEHVAHNTAQALGRLVDLLAQKGILTAREVMIVAEDFSTQSAELIP